MIFAAYSYIRFSTPHQAAGDSLRRQLAKAGKYAEKHGLVLDTTHRDLGLSGYKGINRIKGALRAFLEKVETGEIARGSTLIVENLDRLTREDVLTAAGLFLLIIGSGITVVTLSDGMAYSKESIEKNPQELSISIGQFVRGRGESDRKSELLGDTWQEKRDNLSINPRKVLTRQGPGWLDFIADDEKVDPLVGEWRVNDRAETVCYIFSLCIAGLGKELIARKLNDECIAPFRGGDGWQPSTVFLLLKDRRALGEFQPRQRVGGNRRAQGEPIAKYFPPVIDEATFYSAQAEIAKRYSGATTANKGKVPNLFVTIARCECGRSMEYRDKRGKRNRAPSDVYLICSGCRRSEKLCPNTRHHTYSTVESAILDWVTDIEVSDEEANRATITGLKLSGKIAQRDNLERRKAAALRDLETERDEEFRSYFMGRARALKAEVEAIEIEIAELQGSVATTKRSVIDDSRAAVKRVQAEMANAIGERLFEIRARLAAALRQVIRTVIFSPDGYSVRLVSGTVYSFRGAEFVGRYVEVKPTEAQLAFGTRSPAREAELAFYATA